MEDSYKILWSDGGVLSEATFDINMQVNQWIAKGYKPQGGISIAYRHSSWYYASQAMVKDEE